MSAPQGHSVLPDPPGLLWKDILKAELWQGYRRLSCLLTRSPSADYSPFGTHWCHGTKRFPPPPLKTNLVSIPTQELSLDFRGFISAG